ncbi:hypothetical protein [Cysteiniphilum litorale]|uniref:hypothetical protein n=1 Tax=Cysteiniphilum litorale TaxID=2056700 RepID=UPI003F8852E3
MKNLFMLVIVFCFVQIGFGKNYSVTIDPDSATFMNPYLSLRVYHPLTHKSFMHTVPLSRNGNDLLLTLKKGDSATNIFKEIISQSPNEQQEIHYVIIDGSSNQRSLLPRQVFIDQTDEMNNLINRADYEDIQLTFIT